VDSLKQQAALKLGAEGLGFGNSSAAGRKRRSQEAPGAGAQQQYSSQQAVTPAPSAAAPTSSFKTSNAAHQVRYLTIFFIIFGKLRYRYHCQYLPFKRKV
jgi:hypothetical protein